MKNTQKLATFPDEILKEYMKMIGTITAANLDKSIQQIRNIDSVVNTLNNNRIYKKDVITWLQSKIGKNIPFKNGMNVTDQKKVQIQDFTPKMGPNDYDYFYSFKTQFLPILQEQFETDQDIKKMRMDPKNAFGQTQQNKNKNSDFSGFGGGKVFTGGRGGKYVLRGDGTKKYLPKADKPKAKKPKAKPKKK